MDGEIAGEPESGLESCNNSCGWRKRPWCAEELVETRFKVTRLVRTQSSEIYLVWDGEKRVGQIDVHFAHDTIHATVIFEADLTVNEEEELLAQIDDDVVSSYLPRFEREDFVAHVFRGEEISRYTDCS